MKIKHSFTTTLWLIVSTVMVIGSFPVGIIVSQRISGEAGNTLLILGTIAFFVLGILGWVGFAQVMKEEGK